MVARLWSVYDEFRTIKMNRMYYEHKLSRARRTIKIIDIVIALGSSTSTGIAAWSIWKEPVFSDLWSVIAGITSIIIIIKPQMDLGKNVASYGKLYAGFKVLEISYFRIIDDLKFSKCFNFETDKALRALDADLDKLDVTDDFKTDTSLIRRLEARVRDQHPATSFWIPRSHEENCVEYDNEAGRDHEKAAG